MKEIAANAYYHISLDAARNRAYLVLRGFWKEPKAYANYLEEWKRALSFLRRGFTVCVDLRNAMVSPKEAEAVHEEAQKLLIKHGLLEVAEILPHNQILALQTDLVSRRTGMLRNKFQTLEEAEQWLDSL